MLLLWCTRYVQTAWRNFDGERGKVSFFTSHIFWLIFSVFSNQPVFVFFYLFMFCSHIIPLSVKFLVVTISAFTGLLVPDDPGRLGTLICVVTIETWRMYVCLCVLYVRRDTVGYCEKHGQCVLMSCAIWFVPWNSNVDPSHIACHLVAIRGTQTWKCDIWIGRAYKILLWKGLTPHSNIKHPSLVLTTGFALTLHNSDL
jgi:hypothetical protein